MKTEGKEDVLSKIMITEFNFVIDDMVSYEEIGDDERLMLCSHQHNRGMPEEISTGTSESHVFETDYWCMFAGIEAHLDDVSIVKHRMDALRKKGNIRIGPLTEEYVQFCEGEHKIILEKDGARGALAVSLVNSWES